MKKLRRVAMAAFAILAVVGFSTPGLAQEYKMCLETWESAVQKKCLKQSGSKTADCLERAEAKFDRCVKKVVKGGSLKKAELKRMNKCLDKRGFDKAEFVSTSTKGVRKKMLKKYTRWADKCRENIIKANG